MNDFQQGIGDEEATDAFTSGFPPPTDANDKDTVIKPEAPTPVVKAEQLSEGVGEKTGSSVYIANLQWWTTDADVERLCSTYGPVVNISFLAERSNGKSKGVALVEFSESQAAVRCKEGLSGCDLILLLRSLVYVRD